MDRIRCKVYESFSNSPVLVVLDRVITCDAFFRRSIMSGAKSPFSHILRRLDISNWVARACLEPVLGGERRTNLGNAHSNHNVLSLGAMV